MLQQVVTVRQIDINFSYKKGRHLSRVKRVKNTKVLPLFVVVVRSNYFPFSRSQKSREKVIGDRRTRPV